MLRFSSFLPIGPVLGAALWVGGIGQNHSSRLLADESCGDYGTAVTFVESPAEAAKQAAKEEKLVFVLHVSGHFEVPDYT